jgi:hypothetical protein
MIRFCLDLNIWVVALFADLKVRCGSVPTISNTNRDRFDR